MARASSSVLQPEVTGRRARGRPRRIDREAIVVTAVALVDESGFAGLTLKAVADRLGVTAMALYHHVESREELVDLVVDRLISRTLVPPQPDPEEGWAGVVRAALGALRTALVADPALLASFLRQPAHPNNVAVAGQLLAAFREAGLSGDEALDAFTLTTSFVVGFVAVDHAGGASVADRHRGDLARARADVDGLLDGAVVVDRDEAFESTIEFLVGLIARSHHA